MRAWGPLATVLVVLMAGATGPTAAQPSVRPLAAEPGVVGVTAGSGSLLVAGTSTPFVPHGFNSVGILYPQEYTDTLCGAMDAGTKRQLAAARTAMGQHTERELLAMKTHWRANAVRFQVSMGALDREHDTDGANPYTDAVASVVRRARVLGLVTIVSMQYQFYSCTPKRPGELTYEVPDQNAVNAWRQLIPRLGTDRGIILEVFNEPDTDVYGSRSWTEWATGYSDVTGDGMVPVAAAVRTMAPQNVLLLDGDNKAGTFDGYTHRPDVPVNSAYAVHPYYFAPGPSNWDARFGNLRSAGRTVEATEWNESGVCDQPTDLAAQLVRNYLPSHRIGLFVHSWDAPGAVLVSGSRDPVDSIPTCTQYTGASLAFDTFWSSAGGGDPAPEVRVSSITKSGNEVDAVTVALADNGTQTAGTGPRVAQSVNLLIRKAGGSSETWVASPNLSTSAPWTNGSFTLATASGLAAKPVTAVAGDTLILRVRYAGDSTAYDTPYLVS